MSRYFVIIISCLYLQANASLAMAAGRDTINIVGSSMVFPFAKVVAERFGLATSYKTPTVEQTGTGGGFKEFCQGLGVSYADITNASRKIKASEKKRCAKHGVTDILEIPIGFDGIVVANAVESPLLSLSRRDLFLALAKKVPNPNGDGSLIANPYRTWRDVNKQLPNKKIQVYGPPQSSGTRDELVELAMEDGCQTFPELKLLKQTHPSRYKKTCRITRSDGAFIEAGENDNLIVRRLHKNPDAVGIFGFSFLDQNTDVVQAAYIDGVLPTDASISSGEYPISRPLYVYVKQAHIAVIPGVRAYLREFTSEKSWGDEGYLLDKGMIPLPKKQRRDIVQSLRPVLYPSQK